MEKVGFPLMENLGSLPLKLSFPFASLIWALHPERKAEPNRTNSAPRCHLVSGAVFPVSQVGQHSTEAGVELKQQQHIIMNWNSNNNTL